MARIVDRYGRHLTYVRISVTDRCNFRCRYCMPPSGVSWVPHEAILSYEEILGLCGVLGELGVEKVRFTGGEPLVRKGFVDFLYRLKEKHPQLQVAITTNGSLLKEWAHRLADLNLTALNISLDTISKDKFSYITRGGNLEEVISGIDAFRSHSDATIKINAVLIKDFNDGEGEISALIAFARSRKAIPRFIEFMPLDDDVWSRDRFMSADNMVEVLRAMGYTHFSDEEGQNSGPATYLQNPLTGQRVGIIAAISHHFCDRCNRLRVTAMGEMRSCLFADSGVNLKEPLSSGDLEEVRKRIMECVAAKPQSWMGLKSSSRHMSQIGG